MRCRHLRGIERGDLRILAGNKSSALHWLSRLVPDHYAGVIKAFAK
jgi:hypothetical protein